MKYQLFLFCFLIPLIFSCLHLKTSNKDDIILYSEAKLSSNNGLYGIDFHFLEKEDCVKLSTFDTIYFVSPWCPHSYHLIYNLNEKQINNSIFISSSYDVKLWRKYNKLNEIYFVDTSYGVVGEFKRLNNFCKSCLFEENSSYLPDSIKGVPMRFSKGKEGLEFNKLKL